MCTVTQGQVERLARTNANRESNEDGTEWIDLLWAVSLDYRLRIDRDVGSLSRPADHALERGDGVDGDVVCVWARRLRRRLRPSERRRCCRSRSGAGVADRARE